MKIVNKKKLKRKIIGRRKNAYSLVENELAVLKKLSHLNCVGLIEIIDDP
jgi:[calcium/calmodulin-dependent protein kinase] kinase